MSLSEISPFVAALEPGPERVVVRLSGELDLATRSELCEALEDAVATGTPEVLIDMRSLAFIDSTGIAELLRAVDTGRKHGHDVRFLRGEGNVSRTLSIAGVEALLPLAA